MDILDTENIDGKFKQVVASPEWVELQEKFNNCDDIYVLGHGGNMAVADHTAIDITRLSSGQKNAMCPGSATVATSLINDTNFDQWMVDWLRVRTTTRTPSQLRRSLVYGISSSGKSTDVIKALQWATENGMQAAVVTGHPLPVKVEGLTQVVLGTKYYHTTEVLTLFLQYQLTHGSGRECPPIGNNSPEELEKLNWRSNKIRKHSYPDETINIGIDFDGVIHKCSKGYHDGTIYDDPVDGALESLKRLSESYIVIVNTCKARMDRGLVNGKTGIELVWEWLEKHNMAQYVSKVTSEKPRAMAYIDDKAIRFCDWVDALESMEAHGIIEKVRAR
jgi:phosphoheptose isomerase